MELHLLQFGKAMPPPDSDSDILIPEIHQKNGLIIAQAQGFLTEYLNIQVDLKLYNLPIPYIKSTIQDEIRYL
jgi:predicted nucleotidyltransferase